MQHATVFTKFCSETTLKGHRIVLLCLVIIYNLTKGNYKYYLKISKINLYSIVVMPSTVRIMHLSMFSPRGGGPGIPGGFDIVCLPEGGKK